MTETTIKIENCNNIEKGEINICPNKLNILFGRNGTGKSTIAKVISLYSQGKELTSLAPYGINSEESTPKVEGLSYKKVAIFNDEYVQQYIYQEDTLIKDKKTTFEVFVRSQEYDMLSIERM